MSMIGEIADAVKLLKDVVSNTRDIVAAIDDGRAYLKAKYPQARPDFAELLVEMRATVSGLSQVTGLLTNFSFTVEGPAADTEAVRFNEYVINMDPAINDLNDHIADLKGSCTKIIELKARLDDRAGKSDFWAPFLWLLGVSSTEQATNLANQLAEFYMVDQRMIEAIETMLRIARQALDEVTEALGGPGVSHPYLVPKAAGVLASYSLPFRDQRKDLDSLKESMTEVIKQLSK